jgi:hypothetical protein
VNCTQIPNYAATNYTAYPRCYVADVTAAQGLICKLRCNLRANHSTNTNIRDADTGCEREYFGGYSGHKRCTLTIRSCTATSATTASGITNQQVWCRNACHWNARKPTCLNDTQCEWDVLNGACLLACGFLANVSDCLSDSRCRRDRSASYATHTVQHEVPTLYPSAIRSCGQIPPELFGRRRPEGLHDEQHYVQDNTNLNLAGTIVATQCLGVCTKQCNEHNTEGTCTSPIYTQACAWDPIAGVCRTECPYMIDNVTWSSNPSPSARCGAATASIRARGAVQRGPAVPVGPRPAGVPHALHGLRPPQHVRVRGPCHWFNDGQCRRSDGSGLPHRLY